MKSIDEEGLRFVDSKENGSRLSDFN